MNDPAPASFATDALENLRRRLLDLTARNRLINFAHGRQGNIRVIDALPDDIHEMLLSEDELRFESMPDPTRSKLLEAGYLEVDPETGSDKRIKKHPTALEWARWLGLETSYDLPKPGERDGGPLKRKDKTLQTLMFPSELEARLRGLRSKAETAIEETGANVCYVAFGFLEWFESADSDQARHAPLLLVPVRIAKGRLNRSNGTYQYTITYSGEDILPNLSLREKLRIDFGLALPDLNDLTTPEDYFKSVQQLVATPQPRWRVKRWATVALLNFSKLLMYLDLDPQRWPQDRSITSHPIVTKFFSAQKDEAVAEIGFSDEFSIDDIAEVHDLYPLIDDADSSQHSALVDAVQGKDLVIEGPPGTGKSQTITNLIAATLAKGKRVLFVAEKLAALEVVKRRLDQAGLGDFCLELHSHKTQKRKVLDDVNTRLTRQGAYRQPTQIDADIARYESLKETLRGYATLINSTWKQTGFSIHEILMAASRHREALGIDPSTLHPKGFDGDILTMDVQRQSLDTVRVLAEVYRRLIEQRAGDDLISHPWYGVGNRDLQHFDQQRVCSALSFWQEALRRLFDSMIAAATLLGLDDSSSLRGIPAIESLKRDLTGIPHLQGDEILEALPYLRHADLQKAERHLALIHQIRDIRANLFDRLRIEFLGDSVSHDQLRLAFDTLKALGIAEDVDLSRLVAYLSHIEQLQSRLQDLGKPMAEVALSLGQSFSDVIAFNEPGLLEFYELVKLVRQITPQQLKLRGEWCDEDALDDLLPRLKTEVEALQTLRQTLGDHFALERLPAPENLELIRAQLAHGGLFRWFKGNWRASRRMLMGLTAKPDLRFTDVITSLDALVDYAHGRRALLDNPRYKSALGVHFIGMDTAVSDLVAVRAWYRAVRTRYGIGFGPKVGLGNALIGMPSTIAKGIQSLGQQNILAEIDGILAGLTELKNAFGSYSPLHANNAKLVGTEGPLTTLRNVLTPNLTVCRVQLTDPGASLAVVATVVAQTTALDAALADWRATPIEAVWFSGLLDGEVAPENIDRATLDAADHTATLARFIDDGIDTEVVQNAIYRNPTHVMLEALRELGETLTSAWQFHIDERDRYADLTELDLDAWLLSAAPTLDGYLVRNQIALDNPDCLSHWLDYVRVRYQAETIGFGPLAKALEQGTIAAGAIDAGYSLGVNDLLARQILTDTPGLAFFSGHAHTSLQKQFRHYDEQIKMLQRQRIAWQIARNKIPAGSLGGKVSDYSELALLKHECGKKKRHIPLRQLVLRAGNALVAMKPCFMMGPMSVAQYLAPGQITFDLVVMDEASQMKPEDALGAIARGGQLVVVGDPKQLPPTSFFDKMIADEDADSTAIEESESILDTAIPMFAARRLRWHYRSRHENLIAFSNHAFYDGGLVVFPAPYSESADYGVKFTRVQRGRFMNRRNIEEARVIAMAVQQHILHRAGESLGVVAMSADQREQIERAVEEVAKEDPLFQSALEQNQSVDEPLFIKNLENVQGDERDVIYISCTYGPEEIGGKVFQRFGPINSDVGWRRLNVLFTRAKTRMHVFSSMGSEDIIISERSKRGVNAFKDFLSFAETGNLHRTRSSGRAPDSDFEISVASALGAEGFECEPQVGVAGFFIDLAVRDPGNRGCYLMGIECDGASYHSAKSVRDRDRLRQAVLERLGWRIRRIWSTDWYRNPRAVIEPLIGELRTLRTEISRDVPVAPLDTELAAPDKTAARENQGELLLDNPPTEELELREMLLRFDLDIIRLERPETAEQHRLLRPAMLEALLEFRPVTKSDFVESIPLYLRQATCPDEGKYLEQVLRLIEEAER